jgi:hypothetical protein
MEASVATEIAERFNKLSFHDAILKSVSLDFADSGLEFELEYIIESIQESHGVFRPVYRNARIRLTGVCKLKFHGELDPINKQIIYDFDLMEDSEELLETRKELNTGEIVQFHIYTSSNLSMDVFCKNFVFDLA